MAGGARRGLARLGEAGHGMADHGRHFWGVTHERDSMQIESVDWKQNVPNCGIKPQAAYDALERLREKNGGLTDDAIVEAAKKPSHTLHKWFEWDDTEAAIEHRRLQARALLRSLTVKYKEAPELEVRAYQVEHKARPQDPERTVYSTTDEVLRNPESRDRLIAAAIKAAMDFRSRFKHLHELDAIIESIDKVLVSLGTGN